MLKNDRNYKATFTVSKIEGTKLTKEKELIIEMPFTVNFDINTGTYGSPNIGVFQFYNLNKSDQQLLWFDMYTAGSKYIELEFHAGYGDDMPLIFKGQVIKGSSERESGSVDTITTVQVMSGAHLFKYGYANSTYSAGTKYSDIIKSLINDVPSATIGYITDELIQIPRNQTFLGQTVDLLKRELSGYNVYEDLGEIHVLADRDVIPGEMIVITENSGMLGTPKQGVQSLEVDMIFEPGLRCSQLIYLSTAYNLIKNQTYKIVNIHHRGIISPVVSGNLITTITLFYGDIKKEWNLINRKGGDKEELQLTGKTWIKPVKGTLSSNYGYRIDPITGKKGTFHDGIDIACAYNTPVKAINNGTVSTTEIRGGYGKYILINHGKDANGNNISSAYGHLNDYNVSPGQNVSQGDIIGYSGSTGRSTGPHLHLEIRKNGQSQNPLSYIGAY